MDFFHPLVGVHLVMVMLAAAIALALAKLVLHPFNLQNILRLFFTSLTLIESLLLGVIVSYVRENVPIRDEGLNFLITGSAISLGSMAVGLLFASVSNSRRAILVSLNLIAIPAILIAFVTN